MKNALYGFTDYPIAALGDVPGLEAPIRSCVVKSYDQDKYCTALVGGVTVDIKRGYIYRKSGRCGETPCFSHRQMSALPMHVTA